MSNETEVYEEHPRRGNYMDMRRRRARESVPSCRIKNAYRRAWTTKSRGKPRVKLPGAPSLKAFAREQTLDYAQDWLKNKRK